MKRNLWGRVLADWTSFTAATQTPELSSHLELSVDAHQLQVNRHQGQVEVLPSQQLSDDATLMRLIDILDSGSADASGFLKVLPNMLNAFKAAGPATHVSESSEETKLKQQITEFAGEQAEELIDLHKNIAALETELASQRRVDEIELSGSQMQEELGNLDQKLVSVDELAKRQKQIETILTRYGKLLQTNLENEGKKLNQEIMSLRAQELKQNTTHKDTLVTTSKDEDIKPPRFMIKQGLIMGGISLGIGVLSFVLLRDSRILAVAIVFAILDVALLVLLNLMPAGVSHEVALQSAHGVGVSASLDKRILAMEKFFVDKAWITTLRGELDSQKQAISQRLGGEEYEQLKQLRELVRTEFEVIKQEINSYKAHEIAPEDYLRKRRELDTMKIKRSKLENNLSEDEDYNKLMDALQEFDELQFRVPVTSGFAAISNDYVDVVVDNGNLLAVTTPGTKPQTVDWKAEDLAALFAWLKLDAWAKSPAIPLVVLTNFVSRLSERAQTAINAKISELQSLGQIITVTVQD